MTFEELIAFVFLSESANNKRFVIKSSLNDDVKEYLSNQVIDTIFFEEHANIWVNMKFISVDFDKFFNNNYNNSSNS